MSGRRPSDSSVRDARQLLGVPADAGRSQLAHAYRSQARRLHPDVSPEPDAAQRFLALEAAYRLVLSAVGDAVDAARADAPVATAPSTLAAPPARVGAFSSHGRSGAWLSVGPVRVEPPRRSDSCAIAPSSGDL
jgi:hypothetical protein